MRLRSIGVLLLGLILASFTTATAQERFGSLSGTVTDQSGAAVPGATVTATNKESRRARSVATGVDGAYRILDLDPGRYLVVVELSGFQKAEDENLLILLGRNIEFSPKLQIGAVTEVVNITGTTPQIDPKSVTLTHNVTAEEFDRIPKTRSFQSIALVAPGVNQGDIEAGFQVHGASGSENSYTVDGVVTNSLIDGRARQNTVFEYLQEVQVKTSGVNAEYGGALGGVISAVTKSGGNTFSGEGHYYYTGNGLSASPVPRIQLSPFDNQTVFNLQDAKQKDNRNELGGSIGGPIVRDRLFFFASVSPRFVRRTNEYTFADGTGPLSQSQTLNQMFGKVTYTVGRLRVNGGALVTPTRTRGLLAAYRGVTPNSVATTKVSNGFLTGYGWDSDQTNLNADATIALTSSSFVSARTGYFYDNYKDVGISTTTTYTYQATSVGAANIPANLQGPIGTNNLPRTPITFFDTTKRGFADVDYNHVFTAIGGHSFKAGAGVQRTTNDVDYRYPGGYVYIYWNQNFTSTATGKTDTGTYGYYRVDDFGTQGKVGANIVSLYAQDKWSITPRLTLSLGLRTEKENVPSFRPDIAKNAFEFSFAEKLAPRLGAAYDVFEDGRLKVSGSWGRYFDWTKYSLARGSFGGDYWHIFYRSLDSLDISTFNVNNKPGRDLWGSSTGFRDLRGTQFDAIDPDTKPMFQDSTTAGFEYQWNTTTVLAANYIHNKLTRTIEDFSSLVQGDNIYVIGNPGEGRNLTYPASFAATADFPMPKPLRQYDALEVTLSRRFSKNWFGSANYTLSRLYGNYSGLADSDEISTPTTGVSASVTQQSGGSIARVGSNSHSAWDTDTILWDSHGNLDLRGRLATDRPHVVKLYGSYALPFGTQVGAFVYAASGTPMSTVVNSRRLIEPLLVEGRGDMGRTPFLSHTDLLVSHELRLQGRQKLRLELNVINVFNQKTPTHIFNFLNKGAPGGSSTIPANAIDEANINLAKGYDYRALIQATQEGQRSFDPRYGQADLWQTGAQGQFSLKWLF